MSFVNRSFKPIRTKNNRQLYFFHVLPNDKQSNLKKNCLLVLENLLNQLFKPFRSSFLHFYISQFYTIIFKFSEMLNHVLHYVYSTHQSHEKYKFCLISISTNIFNFFDFFLRFNSQISSELN